ncbi:MAG: sigma factor, partial [Vulcanimicrobiaceae bacterium]
MSEDEREARIRELLPIVRQVARRLHRMVPTADSDDLIGDGSIGLIRAVDAFDPERGVPLEQYARKLILGAMLNGMRRLDPVSERVRRRVRQAENARFALAQELGTVPSLQTLA